MLNLTWRIQCVYICLGSIHIDLARSTENLARVHICAVGVHVWVVREQCVERDTSRSGNAVARVASLHNVGDITILAGDSKAYNFSDKQIIAGGINDAAVDCRQLVCGNAICRRDGVTCVPRLNSYITIAISGERRNN